MNWERVRLGDVCKIDNGYAFKSKNYVSDKGARIIRITNVQKGKVVDNDPKLYPFEMLAGLERYEIFENDIMMSLTGNVGRVGRFPKEMLPAYINQRVCRIKSIDKKLDETYLFHFLNSDIFEREAIYASAGIAQLNLSTNWVADYIIPLPPMSVQKEIVEKLDKAAAIREKSKALLAHYDALAESLFIELFGDPISNEKGWEISTFGAEFKISSGGTPKTNIGEYWEGGNIPWIGSNMCKDEIIYQNDGKFITQKGLENSSTKIFKVNSVLVALVGATIGKTALLKFDTAINQNIAGIVVSDKFNSYFVFYCLRNLYGKFLELGEGSFKMANLSFVRNLEIPLPPLSLQVKFAEMVENIEEQKVRAKAEIEQGEAVFQALLQESFG